MSFNDPPKSTTGIPLADVIVPGNPTPIALKGGPSSVDNQNNTLAPALVAGDYLEGASLTAGSLNADLIASIDVSAYKSVSLQITGTWVGTLTIQASNDNFVTAPQSVNAFSQAFQFFSNTFTANDFLFIPITFRYLRVRMTSYTSGTANGTAEYYTFLTHPFFLWSAQIGTWTVQPGNTANTTPWLFQLPNVDVTALASAARTTTQTVDNLANKYGKGIRVTLDMTTVGTGSVTLSINAKDSVSGKTKVLLAGAAVTTNVTNVYIIYPQYAVVANVSANDVLPATFQLVVTANNANSATYSLGYCILL